MKIKRAGLCVMITIFIFILTGCSTVNREEVMKEVKSTNLSNENIDGIGLRKSIKYKVISDNNGPFYPHPDNKQYSSLRNYDQYWNKEIIMSVDRETSEIYQISTLDGNNTSSTAKGIKNGMSIDKVISTYGKNFFSFKDKEQAIYVIGYVDHRNNLELSFTYLNKKVNNISLSYAFDKLKWSK